MLEEPIVEREEEGLAEEVGDGALRDGHVPEAATAEQVGEQVAGVVKQAPLHLGLLLVDAGRLAPDGEEAPPVKPGGGGGGAEARRASDGPREQRGGGGRGRGHGAGGGRAVEWSVVTGHWQSAEREREIRWLLLRSEF
uniref:GSVIVT01015850001 n=1 Tax=Arundo donax TaxID=35708 RepID=A0A0A9GDK4_ARUDO